jgi:hypothetical protein
MLKQKLMLVQQHEVTIAAGEVPILTVVHFSSVGSVISHPVKDSINFLRSGCPAVQICHAEDNLIEEHSGNLKETIDKALEELKLPEEEFKTEISGRFLLITRGLKVSKDTNVDPEAIDKIFKDYEGKS